MRIPFLLLLISTLGATDVAVDLRISAGISSGVGITDKELSEIKDGIRAITGSPVAATYTRGLGYGFELAAPVAINSTAAKAYPLIVPAFTVGFANNDFSAYSGGVTESGSDDYTTFGGKLYAGFGVAIGDNGKFHVEVLPFIGWSHVEERVKVTARGPGGSFSSADTYNGHMMSYGGGWSASTSPTPRLNPQVGFR